MKNLPNLSDLTVFYLAAQHKNFGKTAAQLNMSAAFVSKRIAILEETLDCKLFLRSTRHISLTNNGQKILEKVEKILDEYNQISQLLYNPDQELTGHLDIVSSFGFGRKHVAPILAELVQLYPGLSINFDLIDNTKNLIEHSIDLDIRIGNEIAHNMMRKKLISNFRVLCASPDYLRQHGVPQHIEDLKDLHYLGISERDQTSIVLKLKSENNETVTHLKPHFISNNGEIIHQLAIDGHGIILRSIWDIVEDLKHGKLIHILPDYWQDADVWAVYPPRLHRSLKLQKCINFIQTCLLFRLKNLNNLKQGEILFSQPNNV